MRTYCMLREPYSVLCGDLNRKEIQKRGGKKSKKEGMYMCVCIADSLCYTVETNTTL